MSHTPAWLTAKVDQKLAMMSEVLAQASKDFNAYQVVMTPLAEPPEGASAIDMQRWELSCDGCGAYCPSTLAVGTLTALLDGVPVQFVFGCCPACRELP